MVWNTEQSPLYQSVEKFNSRTASAPEPQEKSCESRRSEPEPPPPYKETRREPQRTGNLIQRITSDRDFMLIAALILLLWHEKADMKLIAALAFVLLA